MWMLGKTLHEKCYQRIRRSQDMLKAIVIKQKACVHELQNNVLLGGWKEKKLRTAAKERNIV